MREMSSGKKIIGDVGLSLGSKIVAMVLFLIVDIILVRILSFSEYDEWSYFYSIVVIAYNLARVGINSSTKVHVAGTESENEKRAYIWSGLMIRIMVSIMAGSLSLTLLAFLEKLGYPSIYPNLEKLIFLLPAMILFYTILDFFKEVNVALVNFKNIFLISILEFGTSLVFIILFNVNMASNRNVALGYIAGYMLTVVIEILLLRKYFYGGCPAWNKMFLLVKKILKFAFPMYVSNLVGSLLVEMDTVMLGMFSPGQTGVYAIAKSLVTKATNVNLAICVSTMTQFTIIKKSNIKEKEKLFRKIMIFNGLMVASVCIGILILGDKVIVLLYGSDYIYSSKVMKYLLIYYICYATSIFPSTFISYQKKADKILKYNVIMFFCNLCMNILLIPNYGAVGAAIASGISIIPYTFFMFNGKRSIFKNIEKTNGDAN